MREGEQFSAFERFDQLALVQVELERRGYFFHPVPKEHTEALVTGPLLGRLRMQVKKRSFAKVAGRVAITFNGYGGDPRELWQIAEVRAWWRALDAQLPELPALLAAIPALGYNGPGMQLMLLGQVDRVRARPLEGGYDVHVADGPRLLADGVRRIRQAGVKYHLGGRSVAALVEGFRRGAGAAS
jgi:hypothetical protein